MKIAIVTGASAGLGKEYVKHIIQGRYDVDRIWVIARRAERLAELKELYGDVIVPLPLDLTAHGSDEIIAEKLDAERPDIRILVNNAGFGTLGDFINEDYSQQAKMVDLNCRALTSVTNIALKYMSEKSFVVNTCSIASFAPNPRMTTYCSTKAYVLSFSKSLRYELKRRKINVCAICPGPMDTEFLPVAGIEKGVSKTFDTLPRCNPDKVAGKGLKAASKDKGVYTPGAFFKFYRFVAKILPHSVVMNMSKT